MEKKVLTWEIIEELDPQDILKFAEDNYPETFTGKLLFKYNVARDFSTTFVRDLIKEAVWSYNFEDEDEMLEWVEGDLIDDTSTSDYEMDVIWDYGYDALVVWMQDNGFDMYKTKVTNDYDFWDFINALGETCRDTWLHIEHKFDWKGVELPEVGA